ncbi:hypothetical protein GCM10025886_16000 [Tetragenococcus halophilus subsp. flandriensis]|uniref:sulfurtransferase TusA family protein n=1 Tax=Tetragenococcus halophilus TaxID=51669 RepID=UPI0023EA090B|nr:sulfurtransferase TusA family protein [Tetragenococcus halophilus]GMA08449.1 hypothetical protein GCM10025886_16000 [Tetragenococcus halophilus subsp. flandriensis]
MSININAKGLDCPLPLMELKKAISKSSKGDVIVVEFTCPEAVENLPNYCSENDHEVLSFDKLNTSSWKIIVRK